MKKPQTSTEHPGKTRQRPGPFGPAKALLPDAQQLHLIPADTPAADALERMLVV